MYKCLHITLTTPHHGESDKMCAFFNHFYVFSSQTPHPSQFKTKLDFWSTNQKEKKKKEKGEGKPSLIISSTFLHMPIKIHNNKETWISNRGGVDGGRRRRRKGWYGGFRVRVRRMKWNVEVQTAIVVGMLGWAVRLKGFQTKLVQLSPCLLLPYPFLTFCSDSFFFFFFSFLSIHIFLSLSLTFSLLTFDSFLIFISLSLSISVLFSLPLYILIYPS